MGKDDERDIAFQDTDPIQDPLEWNDEQLSKYILDQIYLLEGKIRGNDTRKHLLLSDPEKDQVVSLVTNIWKPTTIRALRLAASAYKAPPYLQNGKLFELSLQEDYDNLTSPYSEHPALQKRNALSKVKVTAVEHIAPHKLPTGRANEYASTIIGNLGSWQPPQKRENPYHRYL